MTALAISIGVDPISERQMALPRGAITNRRSEDYVRCARWWKLEWLRRFDPSCARYASNMARAASLALRFGPGTWLELAAAEKGGA